MLDRTEMQTFAVDNVYRFTRPLPTNIYDHARDIRDLVPTSTLHESLKGVAFVWNKNPLTD